MLEIMELYKEGFNEKVSIGESIEYKGDKYIVIRILKIDKFWFTDSINLKVEVIVQKVGETFDCSGYKKEVTIKQSYNQSKDCEEILEAGDALWIKDIDFSELCLLYQIVSINKFYYEFVDLVVEYFAQLIVPWSQKEINETLRKERKSTFKVLEGKKV
ncbi:hypothetical protein IL099_002204 [Enterococcus hirae]|nr:hypothetical protein [Enterococcus hirae]